MRFFEDLNLGEQITLGDYVFEQDEIINFAQKYDPLSFHTDVEAAKSSLYGALVASGWHTASVWMKLMVNYYKNAIQEMQNAGIQHGEIGPSPGFTDMVWVAPVYAGDRLTYTSRILEKIDSKSKPEWGIVRHYNEATKEDGTIAFKFTGTVFYKRRPT